MGDVTVCIGSLSLLVAAFTGIIGSSSTAARSARRQVFGPAPQAWCTSMSFNVNNPISRLGPMHADDRRKVWSFQSGIIPVEATTLWKVYRLVVPLLQAMWDNCEVTYCTGEDCRYPPFRYALRGPTPGTNKIVTTYAEVTERDDENMFLVCSLVYSVPNFNCGRIECQVRPITTEDKMCYVEVRRIGLLADGADEKFIRESLDTISRAEILRLQELVDFFESFDPEAHYRETVEPQTKFLEKEREMAEEGRTESRSSDSDEKPSPRLPVPVVHAVAATARTAMTDSGIDEGDEEKE